MSVAANPGPVPVTCDLVSAMPAVRNATEGTNTCEPFGILLKLRASRVPRFAIAFVSNVTVWLTVVLDWSGCLAKLTLIELDLYRVVLDRSLDFLI